MIGHKVFSAFLSFARIIGIAAIVIIAFISGRMFVEGMKTQQPKRFVNLPANQIQEVCHEGVAYLLIRENQGFTVELDTNSKVVRCGQ